MSFFTSNDGAQIFYRDRGDGVPVILIHGWPLQSDMFEYQTLELLKSGFRVITYDRRGFGHSDQTSAGYDYNTFASDLARLIETLHLSKVSLVGFSMGGGEIARYLARYGSEKIASAVLVAAVTPYLRKDDSNPAGVDESVFSEMIAKLEEDRPAFIANFAKSFFGISFIQHPVSTETQNWCLQMALQASLKATVDCVRAFGSTDFREDMKSLDIPTLIIHGDADQVVPLKISGEAAASLAPNADLKIYSGAPHGLFITHKAQLNRDLLEFLKAYPATASRRTPITARPEIELHPRH